ncbi:MAG: ATP-dependent nuclease [Lachnospiraceae bacterium]
MKIKTLKINNFKSIRELTMEDVDSALILVGRNSVGKTVVLDAIRAVAGVYQIQESDYNLSAGNITVYVELSVDDNDLKILNENGVISRYKRYDLWLKDFCNKLPSYQNGVLKFTFIVSREGKVRYDDGIRKNNLWIKEVFPKVHYISTSRDMTDIQNEIFTNNRELKQLKSDSCIFDKSRECNQCFQCMGVINKKKPSELSVVETAKLMQYKLMNLGLENFMERLNYYFHKNGSQLENIEFGIDISTKDTFNPSIYVKNNERGVTGAIEKMSAGMKSIYILSLLETYIETSASIPSIILIEDPEMYLHPQLQKAASEILYRLSKKNQVAFTTHSPNLIFNFNSKQIKQVILDREGYTTVREDVDIDEILDDLGYSANDLMNVSFVFIVEGKQDKARLPLLLEKYYGETYDDEGNLRRVSIISTNSCTNIKTYANLKYINSMYLKDQFLMIRDGDGKDPEYLKKQLCSYYHNSRQYDRSIPRVQENNVLILKYYSFENYFLVPEIMAKIGVIKTEESFYDILYSKYNDYLYKLSSVKKMLEREKITIESKEDIKKHMELIRIYVRGHNLYDIFYGRYKGEKEKEILKKYIDVAPRDVFKDILDAIDSFVYFDSKKTYGGK